MKSFTCLALLLLAALAVVVDSQSCGSNGTVRLVDGAGPWEGNVQVCINGIWGWICQNGWGNNDARVVCKYLQYGDPGGISRIYAYYGWPNASQPIWLDRVQCTGSETNILDCPRPANYPVGTASCNHNALAGVVCQRGGPACTNNAIRMIRSQTGTPFNGRGRIEACRNNAWGTVCDDGWGTNDAKVACAQLGFSRNSGVQAYYNSVFGRGYGAIIMRNVRCTSTENSIFSCNPTYNSIGCTQSEDAGARCAGEITTSCVNGDVKLWRAYGVGPAHDGLALYCKNSAWVPVCDDSWRCDNARLFCKKLGYAGVLNIRGEYHYGYYKGTVDRYAWSCSSSHTDLSQCRYYWHSSCNAAHDQIGIVCYSPIIGTACTDGQVRLTGTGSTSSQGRAEYCYEGNWYPFCNMNSNVALAVCHTLGFNATVATVYSDQRFGDTNVRSSFNWLSCPYAAQNLSSCTVLQKKTSCRVVVGKCGIEYGVGCHNPGQCTSGDMRLIDGPVIQEGRLEVCVGGVWGGVCGGNFGKSDAYVACTHLGFGGKNPVVRYNAYHGESDGPILMTNVRCQGWESSFDQCPKQTFPNFWRCAPQWSIGLVCKDSCTWGSVRLTGGDFPNEGTVEVCLGQWSYISDSSWTNANAQVVCNQLGFTGGNAVPLLGSRYGKGLQPLRLTNVSCTGNEKRIMQCPLFRYSYNAGVNALAATEVAGVDCIYDAPTDPPCVPRPVLYNGVGSDCGVNPSDPVVRLQGGPDQSAGRLEYCYNGYWSPFCKMDPLVAQVACRQLGYSTYSWGAIVESGEFGKLMNYSLFDTITCAGNEGFLSQCSMTMNTTCTPNCPSKNLGLRCYNPGICTNGDMRLVDGYIENEGRVEVCVNGVWGSVCDQGWDKTDAHVVCQQLGHPELEPVVFTGSEFGDGNYPIVYTNMGCGGWENNITSCNKQMYPMTTCSRSNVAGALCGYDCNDGDVRLVGSQQKYEGTVQVCFDNIWGQISDAGWSLNDSIVVCRQLGYQAEGTQPQYGSQYGKSNFTIHLSQVSCVGTEDTLDDCSGGVLSLQQGKALLATTNVAGVKCFTPDHCVAPPVGGASCTSGQVRLSGRKQADIPEGNAEYCYNGFWSPICNLGPQEAVTFCRQLQYYDTNVTARFTDGRFGPISNTSFFQGFSCAKNPSAVDLSQCDIIDSCQSTCPTAIGLRCYGSTDCNDGDVRLVNGSFANQGRLEVCSNNIWGSVCSTGFDATDAYVVCNELGLGNAEPTVYNNSYFGDGDGAILFSNFGCQGYEATTASCLKDTFGTFTCSRDKVVGITCQDTCSDSDVRLVGGNRTSEGTVQVCYYNNWGLVSDVQWGDEDAQVVCRQLGFDNPQNAKANGGSTYGKPNAPVQLTNVQCSGREANMSVCQSTILTPDEGQSAYPSISAAGVVCIPPTTSSISDVASSNAAVIVLGILIVALIASFIIAAGVFAFVCYQKQKGFLSVKLPQASMDDFGVERGVTNPIATMTGGEPAGGDEEKTELS